VPLAADDDAGDGLAALRCAHEAYIDDVVPLASVDDYGYDAYALSGPSAAASSASSPFSLLSALEAAAPPTPPTPPRAAAAAAGSARAGGLQPQFNMDSATQLLAYFAGSMLPRFPVLALPADATVAGLARDRPFVLLAVLAATSAARAVGGRSLYDQEFRRVLGLKFVAGQERTLEMLTALLVYCAWCVRFLSHAQKEGLADPRRN